MTIQIDSREKQSELDRILPQILKTGESFYKSKLWVGDYMSLDNPRLVIDRKKDLLELCGNITQQHERFRAELVRAMEVGIKIIVLCEHGDGINNLEDVYFWHNPRLDIYDVALVNGKPKRVQKYPRATSGPALYRSMMTIEQEYGVRWEFCTKDETGRRIVELLGG